MRAPEFSGLKPRSQNSSKLARTSSRKRDTKCEKLLRQALWRLALRYRLHAQDLPGHPDIIFRRKKVVVFVDGDFWHGRNLEERLRRLARGHNSSYWTRKITCNVERDAENTRRLRSEGWHVIRVWESDVHKDSNAIARSILQFIEKTE